MRWDWTLSFATFAWLRYQRRQGWAWLYFLVSTPVLLGVALLPTAAGDACERALAPAPLVPLPAIAVVLAVLGFFVPPLFADRLRRDPAVEPSRAGAVVAIVLQLATLGVIAALIGYSDYRYRSRVAEGVELISALQTPLAEHYADTGRLPDSLADLGGVTRGEYVEGIELMPDGALRARFGASSGRLAGHSVALVPSREAESIVGWRCRSADLPDVCLPNACRTN